MAQFEDRKKDNKEKKKKRGSRKVLLYSKDAATGILTVQPVQSTFKRVICVETKEKKV